MAESDDKKVEVDEVKEFSGGQIKSVEPMAEHQAAGTDHSKLHSYSGGQIVERTDTGISAWIYATYAFVIVAIVAALVWSGAIPGIHMPGGGYAMPTPMTSTGYQDIATEMKVHNGLVVMTSVDNIDMYKLPTSGVSLDKAIENGSNTYQTYCIGCHGPNQDGAGPNAVSLNPAPRNLRNTAFMQGMSYQRIWTSLHKGVPGTAMPRWENTLSDDQLRDVICYVFSLTAPTDPKTGKFIRPSAADNSAPEATASAPAAGSPAS